MASYESWDSFPLAPTPALATDRAGIAQELSSNPDLRRKLMASANAEVGDQNSQAQQAYIESVMNRASARKQTLDQTISAKAYYPPSTLSKLGQTPAPGVQANFSPMIDQALQGSNIAQFATGNQSPPVKSQNAQVALSPGTRTTDDQFVIENPDLNWAAGMGSQPATGQAIVNALTSQRGGYAGPDVAAPPTSDSSGGTWDNFPLV